MIRRSTGLAAVALTLSLLLHFLGIGLTFTTDPLSQPAESSTEAVALGNSFDDIADLTVEPVEPEPVEPVEPPAPEQQEPVPPEEAEVPTSEALVASPNPQQTFAPDTGITPPVSEEIDVPATPERTAAVESEDATPSAGDESDLADARLAPVDPTPDAVAPAAASEEISDTPEGQAAETDTGVENTLAPVPVQPTLTAPVDDVVAALPPETTPSILEDVTPPIDTEAPESSAEQPGGAVTASLRPPARTPNLLSLDQTSVGNANSADTQQTRSATIVSPLTLYSREGIDLFAGQQREGRAQSSGGLGPGNADTTNYAGQVLVHLNRKPPVAVSARGWARVTFRINPDGSLASVDIIDGSGSSEIDRAAKTQVRRGAPFPRPPNGQSRMLTFVYRLN